MPRQPALAALFIGLAFPLAAQPTLPVGTRVRVLTRDTLQGPSRNASRVWQVGSVASSTPFTVALDLAPSEAPRTRSLADVTRIEVSRGWSTRRRSGMVVGGLVSGAAFVSLACAFSNGSCRVGDQVGGFLLYYATGAIPGVLVGGAIGSHLRGGERWEQVWRSPPLAVGARVPLAR